jgi:RHS repeat-associated protein
VKTVRHYTDETDNPSWVTGTGTAAAQTDIFTTALASSLNATRKVNGTTTTTYLNVGNLHGDTITSLQLPSTGYVAGPNELNVFDEYGVQQTLNPEDRPEGVSSQTNPSTLFILNYGSLGQPQRETTDTGIQFMGARGYNPITGQFLSPDPIRGGNETPYNYPNDPINKNDLNGTLGLLASTLLSFVFVSLATAYFLPMCAPAAVACPIIAGFAGSLIGGSIADRVEQTLDLYSYGEKKPNNLLVNGVEAGRGTVFDFLGSELAKLSKAYKRSRSPVKRIRIARSGGGNLSLGVDLIYGGFEAYGEYITQGKKWNWFRSLIY